jgi:hypothetical protein
MTIVKLYRKNHFSTWGNRGFPNTITSKFYSKRNIIQKGEIQYE